MLNWIKRKQWNAKFSSHQHLRNMYLSNLSATSKMWHKVNFLSKVLLVLYIYSHPQTDCFVLSELFSVARHAGRSKLGSKPVQLYVRLCFRPLVHQRLECSPMARETWVQSQVESYQRLKKWYLMPPYIIRYGSRVK